MFTVEELGSLNKLALDALGSVFKEIMNKYPDAEQWEVYDSLQSALNRVDWAIYDEKEMLWQEVWQEVWDNVHSKVEKSKALKVQTSNDPVEAMKAFAVINPEMAKLIQNNLEVEKSKTLKAVEKSKALIRQKSLDQGAVLYSRISTDDNTVEAIVDSLATIETLIPEAHKVVAKALSVASQGLLAGDLFGDQGTATEYLQLGEAEYIESKAKSLLDADPSLNIAACRADVRLSPEFKTLYK